MSTQAVAPIYSRQPPWENWMLGYPGMFVAMLWGFAEGTFFFIIPDVFLSYVAILSWRRTWKHLLASAIGALLGGALLFHWSTISPAKAHESMARVPFVRETMFTKVDEGFRAHGLLAILLGSVSGIPYKLYAVEAPKFYRQTEFLLATPPVRLVRFLLVWAGFGVAASWFQQKLAWMRWKQIAAHATIWVVSYAFYWGRLLHR